MKRILLFASIAAAGFSQTSTESPTGNRTTPPTINSVSPLGVPRGATVEMNIEGLNLAKTSAVYFSEPGIKARILRIKELPDLPDIRFGSNGTLYYEELFGREGFTGPSSLIYHRHMPEGAIVCRRADPLCAACPLNGDCPSSTVRIGADRS